MGFATTAATCGDILYVRVAVVQPLPSVAGVRARSGRARHSYPRRQRRTDVTALHQPEPDISAS